MADDVLFEGREYISSKRAAELTGYTQDYIGQLSRGNLIDARRIGGLWYVSLDSLNGYKTKAESYQPEPPKLLQRAAEPESFISFDGKQYVSAARAAKDTGYHPDYVGQLARSGKILSRQVGNRWYVENETLSAHKEEKDSLLGAVQARSVGIPGSEVGTNIEKNAREAFFTYTEDTKDLIPGSSKAEEDSPRAKNDLNEFSAGAVTQIPIRKIEPFSAKREPIPSQTVQDVQIRSSFGIKQFFLPAALTIVIVLSVGFVSLKNNSIYAIDSSNLTKGLSEVASIGAVENSLQSFADWVESLFGRQIVYTRVE